MIVQVNTQHTPTITRGGVHHVGDVVTVVLAGLKVAEMTTRGPLSPEPGREATEHRSGMTAVSCG